MTRIERIQPSLHKKDRVLVYLTGGRLLRITPEELLRFDLRPGMDLAEDVLEELNRAAARSLIRQQAAEMAGRRMLSQKELSDRLVKKGTDPQEAQETARWLADLGAVDDAAYAGVIVRHYAAMGYGPGRVRQELQRRGIPQVGGCPGPAAGPGGGHRQIFGRQAPGQDAGPGHAPAAVRRASAPWLPMAGYPPRPGPTGPGHGGMSSRWRRKQSPAGDTPAAFNTRIIRGNRA